MYSRGMPILVLKLLNLGKIVLVVGISREILCGGRKKITKLDKNYTELETVCILLNHKSEGNHKSIRKSIN